MQTDAADQRQIDAKYIYVLSTVNGNTFVNPQNIKSTKRFSFPIHISVNLQGKMSNFLYRVGKIKIKCSAFYIP